MLAAISEGPDGLDPAIPAGAMYPAKFYISFRWNASRDLADKFFEGLALPGNSCDNLGKVQHQADVVQSEVVLSQ